MNIPEFTSLLHNPNGVSLEQTIAIEELLEDYPYFQAARIIHLKGLKNLDSFKYNSALKSTAAYTTNRTVLFDFITSDTLNVEEVLKNEEKLISESEVIDLEVVDQTDKSIAVLTAETTLEKVKTVKEELAVGKPLVFDTTEMHSFNQWLQLTALKPIERSEPQTVEKQKDKEKRFDLIEEFIKKKPKIEPISQTENSFFADSSTTENESLMTETLARVYLEQKKYEKAIQAFKILSLKYPEKSSFFADRIKAVKFLQKNNS